MKAGQPPIIGIPTSSIPGSTRTVPRFAQNQAYVHAVTRAGGAPVMIPPTDDGSVLHRVYRLLDGLLLPGGGDVDPARYGETSLGRCRDVEPIRDEMELMLARWAVEDGKPLLGVCRGIQLLNVALGGSLYQDIASQIPGADRHDRYPGQPRDRLSHQVAIDAGSRLSGFLGVDSVAVNSRHHQAIKVVAYGLAVVGRALDGIVEAVELRDHPFALGVQWHPEDLATAERREQRIFDALLQACSPVM